MQQNRQQLLVGIAYYALAILTALFFYREKNIPSEFVQMVWAVLFLGIVPILIIKKGFYSKKLSLANNNSKENKNILEQYNWPKGYVKKQLLWSSIFIWSGSLLFWLFMIQWEGGNVSKLFWKNWQVLKLILINLTIIPVGLLAQEFFFRGFLLGILRNNFNKVFSVAIVAILVPFLKMILAQKFFNWKVIALIVVLNTFLSLLVIRVKSVIFSFFLYWLGFILLNFWVLWQLSSRVN